MVEIEHGENLEFLIERILITEIPKNLNAISVFLRRYSLNSNK